MASKKKADKEEMVKLHNKSKREVILKNGIKSMPNRAVDVPASIANFYVKEYPRDFILYEDMVAPSTTKADLKKSQARIKNLESENEELRARLKTLETPVITTDSLISDVAGGGAPKEDPNKDPKEDQKDKAEGGDA